MDNGISLIIMTTMEQSIENLYKLDGRVPVGKALPFGLQHVLAMFVSNIAPIMILAGAIGLDSSVSAVLIQNCMVIAGIGTLVQLYPVWRIGSRLPIVMGISFTFLSLTIAIAGGQGAADFGSMNNWVVGSVTLLACLLCQIFAKGFLRSLSVLVGLLVGYVLALFMGMIDFSGLSGLSIVALPKLLPFTPEFNIGAILSVVAVYLVSATETIGDTSALCNSALKRDPKTKEMGAAVCCDGFVSSVSGLFGCTPITSFSQNVGLAAMSGVVNRFTIAMGAIIMIIGGIFPAIGYVLTTIPQAVLGGCTIMMFGSILFAGFGMMARTGFSQRNMVIVSLSLSVGLGFTSATGMFNIFPEIVRTVFADNCVAVVFLLAVILNLVLPKNLDKA